VVRREQQQAAWDSEHSVPDEHGRIMYSVNQLGAMPKDVAWRISHWNCLPNGVTDFEYGLELPKSHAEWLEHAAHLMEKNWVEVTDLSSLIREAGTGTGRCTPV
jgi:hypothetical protein